MIANFYENSEIFITGGSGVVGRATIEKLLRSCNVKRIYVLIRSKRGASPEDRMKEISKSKIFRILKQLKPNELDKLTAISGDVTLDCLGISTEHRKMLQNVSVIFHAAATTRFDEPLKQAIRCNLKSTVEALKIAETLPNLKMFTHVSTFYCNPYLKFVEDKVYPALFDWKVAVKLLDDNVNEDVLCAITDKVIQNFCNTYLFTKHLAEQAVNDYRSKLPVAIFKPSTVIMALDEPEPGYTESSNGFIGMVLASGIGIIQVVPCCKNVRQDLTPLDYGTKVLLTFTAQTAQLSQQRIQEACPVSIFSSRTLLEYTLQQQQKFFSQSIKTYPFEKQIWIPNLLITENAFVYKFLTIFLQVLPSMLIDGLLILFQQEPFMVRIQRKIYNGIQVLEFFLTNDYDSRGISNLDEIMEITKGTEFSLSGALTLCDSDEHFGKVLDKLVLGCRKYLLNEDESSLERSRLIAKWKRIAYNVLRGCGVYLVGRSLIRMSMTYSDDEV